MEDAVKCLAMPIVYTGEQRYYDSHYVPARLIVPKDLAFALRTVPSTVVYQVLSISSISSRLERACVLIYHLLNERIVPDDLLRTVVGICQVSIPFDVVLGDFLRLEL